MSKVETSVETKSERATDQSPNNKIMPATALINDKDHLSIGGCDTVELAKEFGTPLYVVDEETIIRAVKSAKAGLSAYPNTQILYAGKAFLCSAMVHLLKNLDIGLDVVSEGELHTAQSCDFPSDKLYMHGNNKSESELERAIETDKIKIVADSESEIELIAEIAERLNKKAQILIRVTPGVEPDTHSHIKTGQEGSKFGFPLDSVLQVTEKILSLKKNVHFVGLHAHIGSQSKEIEPFLAMVDIMVELCKTIRDKFDHEFEKLDVGGGLGIAYVENEIPATIFEWSRRIAESVLQAFEKRQMKKPQLLVELGRAFIGTAGVTLYRAGGTKHATGKISYLSVDGGMADNPRPITYQAKYTAAVANRMSAPKSATPIALAGKYCESGDIIIKETFLSADKGDLVAVFGTGAYNYSMASNYNRTPRPACVLVFEGTAEVIIVRETMDDLLKQDQVPKRLLLNG